MAERVSAARAVITDRIEAFERRLLGLAFDIKMTRMTGLDLGGGLRPGNTAFEYHNY